MPKTKEYTEEEIMNCPYLKAAVALVLEPDDEVVKKKHKRVLRNLGEKAKGSDLLKSHIASDILRRVGFEPEIEEEEWEEVEI